MSRDFQDNNKDVDSAAEVARRQSFIERMSRKLELKESLHLDGDLGGRY